VRIANFLTPFNTFKTTTDDLLFETINHNKLKTWRSVALMITWNLGNLKEDISKKKGVENEDLLKENK
jgi:hypothetical protein